MFEERWTEFLKNVLQHKNKSYQYDFNIAECTPSKMQDINYFLSDLRDKHL